MKKNWSLLVGVIFCSLLVIISLVGEYLPFVTTEPAPEYYMTENGEIVTPPYPPSDAYMLGTDANGNDLLSQLILNTGGTLWIIFFITLIRYLVAIPLAIIASRQEGFLYSFLYGWNHLGSGLPTLFAAILFMHLPFIQASSNSYMYAIIVIALLEAGRVGYIFQQQAYDLSTQTFVESGRMVGNTSFGLYRRYYFPYLLPQMIVTFVLDMGRVMLILGQLALFNIFLSQTFTLDGSVFSVSSASGDWMSMLADSRSYIRTNIWIPFWPTAAIAFAIISINLLGEGLRQHFENKSKSRYNRKLEREVLQSERDKLTAVPSGEAVKQT